MCGLAEPRYAIAPVNRSSRTTPLFSCSATKVNRLSTLNATLSGSNVFGVLSIGSRAMSSVRPVLKSGRPAADGSGNVVTLNVAGPTPVKPPIDD